MGTNPDRKNSILVKYQQNIFKPDAPVLKPFLSKSFLSFVWFFNVKV
jgi:hypothetical protein